MRHNNTVYRISDALGTTQMPACIEFHVPQISQYGITSTVILSFTTVMPQKVKLSVNNLYHSPIFLNMQMIWCSVKCGKLFLTITVRCFTFSI